MCDLVSKCVAVSTWWRKDKGVDSLGSGISHHCGNSGFQHQQFSFNFRSLQGPDIFCLKKTNSSEYLDFIRSNDIHVTICCVYTFACMVTWLVSY